MIVAFLALVVGLLFLAAWFVFYTIITNKRIKDNQQAWNEYSKNMSHDEKLGCFIDFLYARKAENGWEFLYIPKM
jgi:hypothetical protein